MPTPFDGLQPDPTTHFRLYMLEAVQHVLRQVGASFGSIDTAVEHFPFLRRYCDGFDPQRSIGWWCTALDAFESRTPDHLPLRSLRHAARADHVAVLQLL